MQLEHYVAALLLIGVLNWIGRRFASRHANKLIFLATAACPVALWLALMAFLLVQDGVSTFRDPNFSLLLLVVAGCTAATSAVALLGQALGRRRHKAQP